MYFINILVAVMFLVIVPYTERNSDIGDAFSNVFISKTEKVMNIIVFTLLALLISSLWIEYFI